MKFFLRELARSLIEAFATSLVVSAADHIAERAKEKVDAAREAEAKKKKRRRRKPRVNI